jgi:hypothetical protein
MITLILLGAGTVGYHCLNVLSGAVIARLVKRIVICDCATIHPKNAITCRGYRGHLKEPKCNCLAALAIEWFPTSRPRISPMHCRVEALRWDQVLAPIRTCDEQFTIVLAGLDNWDSRLVAMEDLRRYVWSREGRSRGTAFVQIGLDRGQASIAVFGTGYEDPCPACGKQVLPGSEPCVLFTGAGRLLRGSLRREARAAAGQFCQIVEHLAQPTHCATWLNRKANLVIGGPEGTKALFTRRVDWQSGCFGPHSAAGPIRWGSASCHTVVGEQV